MGAEGAELGDGGGGAEGVGVAGCGVGERGVEGAGDGGDLGELVAAKLIEVFFELGLSYWDKMRLVSWRMWRLQYRGEERRIECRG